MSKSIQAVGNTTHSHNFIDHLKDPFCKQQSTLQKAAVVFAHIVLFPLGIYRICQIIYHCVNRPAIPTVQQKQDPKVEKNAIDSVRQVKFYEDQATRRAKEFADAVLATHVDKKIGILNITGGPNNDKIARLMDLANKHYLPEFIAFAKTGKGDGSKEALYKKANEYMQIAYAISHYTLEDYEPFKAKLSTTSFRKENLEKMYMKRLLFCSEARDLLNSGISAEKRKRIIPKGAINFIDHFFKDEKKVWKSLYNDIETRIKVIADKRRSTLQESRLAHHHN